MSSIRQVRAAVVLATVLGASSALADHLEAQVYVIDNFQASGSCQGADRCWSSMVDDWYDEMDDHGWYNRDRRFLDGSLSPRHFSDPDQESGGQDHLWVDDGDAAMIATHGFDSGGHWEGLMRSQGTDEDCRVDAPEAGSGELFVGDMDLEFLHFSSCNSMDDDNLANVWRLFEDPADSPGNGRRLHQADGFHGVMWIFCNWGFRYEDFAEDGFAVSLKDAWLSNMYVQSVSVDTDNDGVNEQYPQCPVAYAVGADRDDCLARLQNERYNFLFSDPGPIGYACAYAFVGCNPLGDDAFNF